MTFKVKITDFSLADISINGYICNISIQLTVEASKPEGTGQSGSPTCFKWIY